ncbi:ethanolamine ammonia-lyase subunit EutB [Saccharococcus caldoxylosilyticus]|uniref:Ethanolamine ammonia-lyase large subunit n=4 Tax=Saccharococcus caldoxylosilyticus TaxID=81408 RepID=A0A023DJG9_9BACL|nr:ethanolamine ammonia-lyase subunit EutB [Parageobacillus caldoxylosilyticus]KYD14488.1 Ethanolamine ammonia-lyase heavy chain [Parageobacillus caldoxylosilyticus]MBB3852986.1 ethanolamine ammonia-lyase large subunit [Parageobacillus caldoxylosilyticus]QXJ40016.1 Ethanolamine ammonia-lyase heavy chain [Parageobacillus caldoxylosilyticus]GAJ41166.1 ethanolamine ammonia-lyase heavy chain [Parageobacillus caldoxylosilyticus NBRC 107762]
MKTTITLMGKTYQFKSLKEIMAKANEEKSGDQLAGIHAQDAQERIAARHVLSELTLADIRNNPLLPPEEDEVSRVIEEGVNEKIYASIRNWTVAELREYLLSPNVTNNEIAHIRRGLTSEMIAAVTKIMTNLDLIQAASKITVETRCNTTIGQKGRLAGRAQPNHPNDNLQGIKAAIFEALSYGVGDAVIGINPVIDTADSVKAILNMTKELIEKWNIPTQNCVLAHVTTQMRAIKQGGAADLLFQSLAGTELGNKAFGISVELLDEANELILKEGTAAGPNVWYFETGQGSELSADAHHGIDQLTLEARCYGLAKRYKPFIVNTVVGFIGPEYLYNSKQVIRAGLEDHFMGKLHGLPMGVDVCYTNHMKADQNDMENLAVLLAAAGVNFLIGVAMADDCMLNYQSLSFHDIATLRELLHMRPAPEFERWLEKMGIMENGRLTSIAGDPTLFL